jgi:hypothetical protein
MFDGWSYRLYFLPEGYLIISGIYNHETAIKTNPELNLLQHCGEERYNVITLIITVEHISNPHVLLWPKTIIN